MSIIPIGFNNSLNISKMPFNPFLEIAITIEYPRMAAIHIGDMKNRRPRFMGIHREIGASSMTNNSIMDIKSIPLHNELFLFIPYFIYGI